MPGLPPRPGLFSAGGAALARNSLPCRTESRECPHSGRRIFTPAGKRCGTFALDIGPFVHEEADHSGARDRSRIRKTINQSSIHKWSGTFPRSFL